MKYKNPDPAGEAQKKQVVTPEKIEENKEEKKLLIKKIK
jgi:hypothetical protein